MSEGHAALVAGCILCFVNRNASIRKAPAIWSPVCVWLPVSGAEAAGKDITRFPLQMRRQALRVNLWCCKCRLWHNTYCGHHPAIAECILVCCHVTFTPGSRGGPVQAVRHMMPRLARAVSYSRKYDSLSVLDHACPFTFRPDESTTESLERQTSSHNLLLTHHFVSLARLHWWRLGRLRHNPLLHIVKE